MLLRYAAVISFGRHGTALLSGLAAGAVVVASMAVVPGAMLPVSWSEALGTAAAPAAPHPPTPPSPPTVVPPTVPSPPTVAVPAPAVPNPPAPPTTGRPAPPSPAPSSARPPTTAAVPPPAVPITPSATLAPAGTAGVVSLTNAQRAAAGCAPLRRDDRLDTAALLHSQDMSTRNYFAHDSLDGRSFADRITAAGYPSPGGENIARGQTTASEVMTDWMNSPGHKRNILDCTFTTIGVGFDEAGNYWTQDFGR